MTEKYRTAMPNRKFRPKGPHRWPFCGFRPVKSSAGLSRCIHAMQLGRNPFVRSVHLWAGAGHYWVRVAIMHGVSGLELMINPSAALS